MIEYFDSLDELKIVLECMNPQNKEVKIQDLYDFISDNGRLNETVSRDIFKQLIKIVHDITSVGIMHGDIKDENILIDPQNLQIKLIDFGAGTVLHNDIYRYYNGTIVYAPPEWFIRGEYRAEGLNTWSLGILLYNMSVGNVPFHNEEQIKQASINFNPSLALSESLKDLISRCLIVEETERIKMSEIMAHPWLVMPGLWSLSKKV